MMIMMAHTWVSVCFCLFITVWSQQCGVLTSLSHAFQQYLTTQTGQLCCALISLLLILMLPTQWLLDEQKFCKSWRIVIIIHLQGIAGT
jgi:type IV secretory pathway VirB2 component (pilin)